MYREGPRADRGYVLAIGFGTTVAMWAVGYVCRLPPAMVPNWLLFVLLVGCLVAGGVVAGRATARGWRAGLQAGMLSSLLNLLILGSLLGGESPGQISSSALLWLPGSILLGGLIGAIGAAVGTRLPRPLKGPVNWTCAFASVTAVATFFLLIIGGFVTGKEAGLAVVDWPNTFGYNMFLYPLSRMTGGIYYEHVHRLFGTLVGLSTLVLAIHLQRVETRRWLRRLALLTLPVVVLQGILGGLRVTGRFTFTTSPEEVAPSIALAVAHGVFGQLFFGMLVALAVFASTSWRAERRPRGRATAATDRSLSALLVAFLVVQLVVGALLRHVSRGLHLHLTLAVAVIMLAIAVGVRVWGMAVEVPVLPKLGRALTLLTGAQIVLGIAALIAVGATAGVTPRPALDVVLTTAHQAVGAGLLALAVMLALWTRRVLVTGSARDIL